jgi:hypothetical protein
VTAELKEDRATEVEGASRDEALKEFESGRGWYRGANVDQLSEGEAGIIAARLVRRMQAKTALAKDKAEALQRALTQSFTKCFTSGKQESCQLEDIAGKYLDQEQIKILRKATEKGVRPLPNEK